MATNVAASSNGGTATASSDLGSGYLPSGVNNGDRTGGSPAYGSGGDWTSAAFDISGAWIQVEFSGSFAINEIDVFGLQDAYTSPSTPTLSMTSVLYGLQNFDVEYWTGSAWTPVPGGVITGNNHVWVQLTFSPITTTKVRVLVHTIQSGSSYTHCAELEAWDAPSAPGSPSSPNPADTATGVSLSPTLSWTSSGADLYDVYFGTSGTPPLVNSDQAAATYVLAGLSGSTLYHWKIVAKNSGGSTTGSVWAFTTGAFAAGAGLFKPTEIIEAEFSGAGMGWTDITADVRRAFGIRCRHGMQGSTPGDLVAPAGSASYALDNSTQNSAELLGYYSPYHSNCRAGWRQGIGCRIRFQNPNTGVYTTRFVGYVDAINPVPGRLGARYVSVTLTNWTDEAARFVIPASVGVQVQKRWDEVLASIIAEMPVQPVATSLDAGVDEFPISLDTVSGSKQYALAEFVKLANSEYGLIYEKADGTVKAEGRHARLLNTTSIWTIAETELQALSLPSTRAELVNKVVVTIHPKVVDPEPTTLIYDQANTVEIAANTTQNLTASFRDQITGRSIGAVEVADQDAGTDYIANDRADGGGADATNDIIITTEIGPNSAEQSVENTTSLPVFLTDNLFYGRGVYDYGTQIFQSADGASIAVVGEHTFSLDMFYQGNANNGQGAADYIRTRYSGGFAQARAGRVVSRTATVLAQMLASDISDRVTITETVTGVSDDYFINGMEITMTAGGSFIADYIFAPAYDPYADLYFILDASVLDGANVIALF